MGTRSFIGVVADGKYKIAQYSQWDGYISGQGATVLDFLSKTNVDTFREKLNNCRFINESELRQLYVNAGDEPNNKSGWVSSEVANKFNTMYPSLSRDTGAGVLDIVYESVGEVPLWNREDFIDDAVWCEFGYVIDVDRETLHCYTLGKNLFGAYIFEELPTVEQMQEDFNKWYKQKYGIDIDNDEGECECE